MDLEQILSQVTNTTNRLFGIEIEVNGINPAAANNVLTRAGINARHESYNHQRRTWWKVTTDGSLSGRQESCEVVSPPLPFNVESLKLVAGVLRTLRAAGATVDDSCGIHVHIDSRDLVTDFAGFARVLFLRYRECESIIDQMVAPNRRNNGNTFCKTLKSIGRTSNFGSLRYDRYQKLNFNSFERHGTVEFRQHEGCLDDKKVVSWVIFCMVFFEDSRLYFRETGIREIQEAQLWNE